VEVDIYLVILLTLIIILIANEIQLKFPRSCCTTATCSNALNWQGAGSWGNGNMTVIWDYINANFSKAWPKATVTGQDDSTLSDFTYVFSN
jgi:hypothetical protein